MHEVLVYNKTRRRIGKTFVRRTVLKSLDFLKLKRPAELAVLILSEARMRNLNRAWRGKNRAAEVLAFGSGSRKFVKLNGNVIRLGEIMIDSKETTSRERLSHLLIHGLLHLVGYGHETTRRETAMQKKEKALLENLRIK